MSASEILLIAAIVSFALAFILPLVTAAESKINLIAIGLFFWALSTFVK